MSLNILSLNSFDRDVKKLVKKYPNIFQDLGKLKFILIQNPKSGVNLGDNLYKIRIENSANKKGKNAGFRVIYYYIDNNDNLFLIKIFSKNKLQNIPKSTILKLLKNNLSI
jgi:mRNA-degrading endonuclease RelE of RelBE toxin-antitoxin system